MNRFVIVVCFVVSLQGHSFAELQTWLQQGPCPGKPQANLTLLRPRLVDEEMPSLARIVGRVHGSHRIQYSRGVFMCLSCGAFGSRRIRMLRQPCKRKTNSGRKAALARWRKGLHPDPEGVWQQPRRVERAEIDISSGSD